MRLMTRYNRRNMTISMIVLLIGGVFHTLITRWILMRQLDQDLLQEKEEILEYAQKNHALPSPMAFKGQTVYYEPATKSFAENVTNEYRFVNIPGKKRPHFRIFRKLEFPILLNGNLYKGYVIRSQAETEDMIKLIAGSTFLLVMILLTGIIISNRIMLNRLWLPFQETLRRLKEFKLSEEQKITLKPTDVLEFSELNDAVTAMTGQAEKEYLSLKEFTENASHEIQTPLAIIKSKLELLMQSQRLDKTDVESIMSAYEATIRLSKLNNALLLLTRIENLQYNHEETVSLRSVIQQLLTMYEDLIKAGHISLQLHIETDMIVRMDENLAEILIGNLIRNAIRHNVDHGFIHIKTEKRQLVITNSGPEAHRPEANMFLRFQKDSQSSKSLGLGLAIAKKIADQYHFTLQYTYHEGIHMMQMNA